MENVQENRYGNVGILAIVVYRNFELCLMFIAGFVFGGLMSVVGYTGSGMAAGIWLASATAVCIGLTLVATHLFDREY